MMLNRERSMPDMFIKVEYGLHQIGDQKPYFSVTAHSWTNKGHSELSPDHPLGRGQMHKEVLRAWPDLADLVALHLSDEDGVPMHALANSWYFYGREEFDKAARLLRVNVADLPANADKETFTAFVDAQRKRWRGEAINARVKHGLVDG